MMMKYIVPALLSILFCLTSAISIGAAERFVFTKSNPGGFQLVKNSRPVQILSDDVDKGVRRAVNDLHKDFQLVTGNYPGEKGEYAIIIGTAGKSSIIDKLLKNKKLEANQFVGKTEKYIISTVDNPTKGIEKALVIAGSDKRGTIYGIYELSSQIGVSPWYWWADVPVDRKDNLFVKSGIYTDGEPAVRYRGIFINDEAPAFQGWCVEKFGGVNSKMYEHMFELILRLKGNFLWPAMWSNAFYDDDPRNGSLADEMGIVIGTTHHEPMGRAHDEWRRYGKGEWNYNTNAKALNEFWESGLKRMKGYETLVTVGMRGDGDEPMSEDANIELLQKIVQSQRQIIEEATGKKAEQTPQVWALYKEVQEYYDKGMKVPDDITLLLCDDNWGNIRKLPDIHAPKHKGGYGMYYHFDYVGAPRNYKWINVSQIQRTWEQMNLCYTHGVDRIWIVNVGDLKPMEYPISFFLDMAWNPADFNAQNLIKHTENWCARQFGEKYAKESARLINLYSKYNRRVTPEMLDDKVFSLSNYNEFETVVNEYKNLLIDASRLYNLLPNSYKDAFDELVLFPINGMCNLYEMYYALALNKRYAKDYDLRANVYADKVKECFERDSLLTEHYNRIADGKWVHMMDQIRIGYTIWQQPAQRVMPQVEYVSQKEPNGKVFVEKDGYVSIEANHFARSQGNDRIHWEIIPDLSRTESGVSTFPANAYMQPDDSIYLEYDFQLQTTGELEIRMYLAPTLNFNGNKGLRYALSIDRGPEKIVNFNGHYRGELGRWQGEAVIINSTKFTIEKAGLHTLRVRALEPGIVFEKLIIDCGGLKPSYLGTPQSEYVNSEYVNNELNFSQQDPSARFDYFRYKGNDVRFEKPIDWKNQYFNPIIAGFYPDPSICRKGDAYYLVHSSFAFYPGAPIFTGKDLVHWTQLGHVLDRPSQLNLDGAGVSRGIYAPAIEYNPYNDTFYLITTNVSGVGNFFVKTKDPAKGWSDPIPLPEISGIDPSFFFDADGKSYIVHNAEPENGPDWLQQRSIRMYEFDVARDKVIGNGKEVIRGGSKPENKPIWVEGPHLYKINGYYYLMCAEGGTSIDHSEVVFRSKTPWGPYESYKNNPILTQRDLPDERNEKVTCSGHADLIETPEGDWWTVFLACRPYEDDLFNTGRETFLLPVEWKDGFPEILPQGKSIPTLADKKNLTPVASTTSGNFEYKNEFDTPSLDYSWIYLRTPREKFHAIEDGKLILTPLSANIEERKSPAAIFRRQQHTNFEVETQLEFSPKDPGDFAGFTLFQNEQYRFVFGKTMINGIESLVVNRVEKDKVTLASIPLKGKETTSPIQLKIIGKGRYYDFVYSLDGQNQQMLVTNADGANLSTRQAGGFTGACIGLYTTKTNK
jgi:beta-xylosidase